MRPVTPAEANWTRNHFAMLLVGGVWAIPRSGLLFLKTADKEVVLIEALPFLKEMRDAIMLGEKGLPQTEEELQAYQREDYFCVAARIKAAGLKVESQVPFIPSEEPTHGSN